jgi:putative tryptophan/tyrosine transport system substrate-binding protein
MKKVSPVKSRGFLCQKIVKKVKYNKGMRMELKRSALIIGFLVVIMGFVVVSRRSKMRTNKHMYTIGILQTASHPALDAAREGFMAAAQEKMGSAVDFVIRNGQGSISSIHTIAQQFHAKSDIDAIFAIATPAAQAMVAVEKEKPIIVAAVSVTSELADNFSADNICGVSDMIDVRKEVIAMKGLLPEAVKSVGILFCSAEINSVAMANIMVTELERAGYVPQLFGVASEADMEAAVASAVRRVDALLCPTDNVVANAIALIANIAAKAQKPLIVSDNLLVQYGALMARGVDYYQSGQQAGEIATQVIVKKRKPADIAIIKADNKEIYINTQMLEALSLTIADSINNDVVLVDK